MKLFHSASDCRVVQLCHQVAVSLTEWNELLLLPQAWSLFMQRCFSAYLEVSDRDETSLVELSHH